MSPPGSLPDSPSLSSVSSHNLDVTDADWLASLQIRETAFSPLVAAAGRRDPEAFGQALLGAYEDQCHLSKRERSRLLATLEVLWSQVVTHRTAMHEETSFVYCLFSQELSKEDLSGRLEAIMAGSVEKQIDHSMLTAAHWLLRIRGKQLEPRTFFTLLRWTTTRTRVWLEQRAATFQESSDPQAGCAAFDLLELQLMAHGCLPGRKGEKKEWKDLANAWRTALDAITDTDGTPHARWLSELLPRICQLAAVSLFADSLNLLLWTKKDHKRLQDLWGRTALLYTPDRLAFHDVLPQSVCPALLEVATAFHLESQPGLLALLKQWKVILSRSNRSTAQTVRGKFPQANVQSDWAEWASLRSAWHTPVDQCLIRYEGHVPHLEMIVADQPLFSGAWEHELSIGGQAVASTGEWACCCWYADRQATFLELQLNRDDPVQVIRQALLLREESVFMVADSIRAPAPAQIEFKRRLPLVEGWAREEDTLSRELAFSRDATRVRVFPWTSPQMRLNRSDESISFPNQQLQVAAGVQGSSLYVATLFDWSEKRREDPIEWQRVTVAEDGKIVGSEAAVGFRLRLGKKQWVLYHSHRAPVFPRSVLGIHTLSETVFARLSARGEAEPLVEVEL